MDNMTCSFLDFGEETRMSELVWVLIGIIGFLIGWFIPHRGFLADTDPEFPEAHSIED